jgi:hypothetical protein
MPFDLILRENGFGSEFMKPIAARIVTGMIASPVHPRTARCSARDHEMTSYVGKPALINPLSDPETASSQRF